jgi:hypothetical protein
MTIDTESLSCQEFVELVTDYFEGVLDADRTARFDELLCIETRLSELSRVKVRFDYRLLREPEGDA